MTYMYYRIRGADSQSGNREWRLYQKSEYILSVATDGNGKGNK